MKNTKYLEKYARNRRVKVGHRLSACFVENVGDTPISDFAELSVV